MIELSIRVESKGANPPKRVSPYFHFRTPVFLITDNRGREVFTDSRILFKRLEWLAEFNAAGSIMSIQQGEKAVSESGVAALICMMETVGFGPFFRASRKRKGPERATFTRFNWDYLTEYLGWRWLHILDA